MKNVLDTCLVSLKCHRYFYGYIVLGDKLVGALCIEVVNNYIVMSLLLL